MTEDGNAIAMADIGAQLKRRWLVIVLTLLGCLAGATAFGMLHAPAYSATSVLTVRQITANPFDAQSKDQQVNITTERAVILSTEVGKRAGEIMGSAAEPRDLVARISVDSPLNSQVMEITAEAQTADEAAATANAFAEGYLDVRSAAAVADAERLADNIDSRIADLTKDLPGNRESPAAASIQQQINNLRDEQSQLRTMAINPGRIITVATPPRNASSFGLAIYIAGGLAVGLLLGMALALLRERLDGRVRSAQRLADLTGLPVIEGGEPDADDEFLDRLIVRLGLSHDAELSAIGILGTDGDVGELITAPLAEHLLKYGFRAQSVPMVADPGAGEIDGPDEPAKVVLITRSTEAGVARTAMLAQRLDKVVVATRRSTKLRDITRLLDEIATAGASIDVVGVIRQSRKARRKTQQTPAAVIEETGTDSDQNSIDDTRHEDTVILSAVDGSARS